MPMKPIYISKKEVARIFNKSASTITRWSKEIPDFPKPFLLGQIQLCGIGLKQKTISMREKR